MLSGAPNPDKTLISKTVPILSCAGAVLSPITVGATFQRLEDRAVELQNHTVMAQCTFFLFSLALRRRAMVVASDFGGLLARFSEHAIRRTI